MQSSAALKTPSPNKEASKDKRELIWWDDKIEQKWNEKQNLISKINGSISDMGKLKSVEEDLTKMIWKAKNDNFRRYASTLNHNRDYTIFHAIKYIGKPIPPKITTLAIKTKDGQIITNPNLKAKILSQRFQFPLGEKIETPK